MTNWLKRMLPGRTEKRDVLKALESILGFRLPANTLSGTSVTPELALTVSAYWCGLDVISSAIASTDIEVVRIDRQGRRQSAVDHPAYTLITRQPNPHTNAFEFRRTMMVQALLFPACWIEVERADGITPSNLWMLDPRETEYVMHLGRLTVKTKDASGTRYLLPENVICIKGLSLDGVHGQSVVDRAREAIGLALATEQFSATYFGNGTWMGAFIETVADLGKTGHSQLIESLKEINQGPQNAHKLTVLPPGTTIKPNEIDNQRAQLNELRRYQILEVCRFLRIQPTKLMDYTDGTYANFEQANIEFYSTTLLPWLTLVEAEFTSKLFTKFDVGLCVRHSMTMTILRGDPSTIADVATKLVGGPVMTPNEGRALFGLNPVEGGDQLLQPLNMGVAEDADPVGTDPALNDATEVPQAALAAPTPRALPAPVEASREALRGPVRGVVEDAVGRLVRREVAALRRAAAKPEQLLDWVQSYYADHAEFAAEALGATVALVGTYRGERLDAKQLGHQLAEHSREVVSGIVKSRAPEEVAEAIERVCGQWIDTRVGEVAECLIGGESEQS